MKCEVLTYVDCDALKVSHACLSVEWQATRTKFSFRWAHLDDKEILLYGSSTGCPHCGQQESHSHLLTFCAPRAIETREDQMAILEEKLTQMDSAVSGQICPQITI